MKNQAITNQKEKKKCKTNRESQNFIQDVEFLQQKLHVVKNWTRTSHKNDQMSSGVGI